MRLVDGSLSWDNVTPSVEFFEFSGGGVSIIDRLLRIVMVIVLNGDCC